MAQPRRIFSFTYADLQELTGLSKAGVSQHIKRGNLDANDLLSTCAFLCRHGKPEIRLEIMQKMMGIDRQVVERNRPQSTLGVRRDQFGRVAEGAGLVAESAQEYKTAASPTAAPKSSKAKAARTK